MEAASGRVLCTGLTPSLELQERTGCTAIEAAANIGDLSHYWDEAFQAREQLTPSVVKVSGLSTVTIATTGASPLHVWVDGTEYEETVANGSATLELQSAIPKTVSLWVDEVERVLVRTEVEIL